MTTSSLILNALVCLAIAAVRARSSQNFLRASAETATKPSAPRALAMRTTSEAALRDGVVVVADDVAEQHHLRPAVALRLGRVADRLHVALVQMLEAGEHQRARPPRQRVEVALDLDDRGRRVAHLAEELEAHGADRRRHPVQDEARRLVMRPSQPSFWMPGRPGEELVGDVLAEARLAKRRAGNRQRLAAASPSCRRAP